MNRGFKKYGDRYGEDLSQSILTIGTDEMGALTGEFYFCCN